MLSAEAPERNKDRIYCRKDNCGSLMLREEVCVFMSEYDVVRLLQESGYSSDIVNAIVYL
jgi:hypothetical protein